MLGIEGERERGKGEEAGQQDGVQGRKGEGIDGGGKGFEIVILLMMLRGLGG